MILQESGIKKQKALKSTVSATVHCLKDTYLMSAQQRYKKVFSYCSVTFGCLICISGWRCFCINSVEGFGKVLTPAEEQLQITAPCAFIISGKCKYPQEHICNNSEGHCIAFLPIIV